jgi:hypothetical protein
MLAAVFHFGKNDKDVIGWKSNKLVESNPLGVSLSGLCSYRR